MESGTVGCARVTTVIPVGTSGLLGVHDALVLELGSQAQIGLCIKVYASIMGA